jgi:Cu/Ag efflux pump CusA
MWIVRLALRRPYSFTVMAILIVLIGVVTITRMSTDIFPNINIPVVSVIWSYAGVAPEEMEKRFVTVSERAMTTTVNDIEHIESQSYNGVSVIKVFFHEGAKVEAGVAQITSIMQTLLRIMPPGTTPPLIIQYSASNVPILQLGLTGKGLSEQQLYDLGLNFIRTQLATIQGAQVPLPYGGKSRQVMVDIDLQKLYGKGLSPADVSTAVNAQNVILPAGTQKIGDREYNVRLNSSPELLETLNDLPIKQVNGAMVYMQVEVQVPNHDGKLYAGMYGQVKFLLVDENPPIVVPANAFLFRKEGPQVATIENKDRIHWQNIRVGRDFGDRIEVIDGLKENSKVVMNPTDDLREGIQVEVKSTEESNPGNIVAQSTSTR